MCTACAWHMHCRYVILSGEADVVRRDKPGAKELVLATLGQWSVFGEKALLEDAPRFAGVRGTSKMHPMHVYTPPHVYGMCAACIQVRVTSKMLKTLKIDREHFEAVFGPVAECLKKVDYRAPKEKADGKDPHGGAPRPASGGSNDNRPGSGSSRAMRRRRGGGLSGARMQNVLGNNHDTCE